MKERYLEVTFRKGRPLAAYLYLPRAPGAKSVRTEAVASGLLVDYGADGEPIGFEITAPTKITVTQLNAVLAQLGLPSISPQELDPLHAA
jgi:uncharacterized protein YuzE